MVKRHNNSSGIHRLQTDNSVIEDSKLITNHILNFYAESNSNDQATGSMKKFICTYIPETVSSEENIILIKCSNYLKIKNETFNLNGNNATGSDGFDGVFYHFCWEIIGTNVCKDVQQFLNKIGFFLE